MNYCPHCMSEIGEYLKLCPHCGREVNTENQPHQLPVLSILHGRYMIGKVLGEGGFGITYIGRDLAENRPVAVKEYYPNGLANRISSSSITVSTSTAAEQYRKGKEAFINEAKRIQKFSGDENIVNVLDVFYENGTAYIVMEYIDGMTLSEYLRRYGTFKSFDELYAELRPVLASLSRVHEAGMIHRDISPSNLMREKTGKIKLIDFGTARDMSEDGEKSLSVVLKHGFAPPEQYTKHGRQGAWTDVYAMCATIYKLLTGVTPESAPDRGFAAAGMKSPSKFGVRIRPGEERTIEDGMALPIDQRIPNMKELIRRFDSARDGADTPSKIEIKPIPEKQRKILFTALIAAAVLIITIVTTVGLVKSRDRKEETIPAVVTAEPTPKSAEKAGEKTVREPVPPTPNPTTTAKPTAAPRPTEGRATNGNWVSEVRYNAQGQILSLVESGVEWEYVYSEAGEFRYRVMCSRNVPSLGSSNGMTIPGTDITYRVLSSPVENCVGFSFDYRINYFAKGSMDGDRWVYALTGSQNSRNWSCVGRFEYDVYSVDMQWHEVTIRLDAPQILSAFGTPRVNSDNYSVFDNEHIMKAVWIADYENVRLQSED